MNRPHLDLQGARILLVDDRQANLDILCTLLEDGGYKILMASDGHIALRIAARVVPDLILLDVMMPGIDGYEVCRRLKHDETTRDIPVIFVTANDQTEDVVAGFEVGGVDYMPKPFRDREVLVRVSNALTAKFLFDQNRGYQERMEKELQTAHDLQMGLMPEACPELAGIEIAGRCIPAEEVGGDVYQYFQLPQGELAISLADATGHAMKAAIPVVLFSGMLETQMELGSRLEELYSRLNRSICRIMDERTYVCFTMAQLDPVSRRLRLANAGCPYPIHYRAAGGETAELRIPEAYPLGVRGDSCYQALDVQLDPGDRVVFCSDGIAEAENSAGEAFGFERTAAVIRAGCGEGVAAEALLQRIIDATHDFSGEAPAADDRTCVVVGMNHEAQDQ